MAQNNSANSLASERTTLSLATETTQWIMKDLANAEKNLRVPEGYQVGVEISTALLDIAQNAALARCTKESIMTALRNMVLQGLSAAKKQCYFVPYGTQAVLQRSYFGTVATLKIAFPYLEVAADVLYEGDGYQLSVDPVYGFKSLTLTSSSIDNLDNAIKAAYGHIIDTRTGKKVYGMVMTWKEIQKSWARAKTKNVQQEFPQEMAKRTLIQRMCKMYINTTPSLDSNWAQAWHSTETAEYSEDDEPSPEPVVLERATAARSRSKGAKGLKAMSAKPADEEATGEAPAFSPETGEIIEIAPEAGQQAGPESFADDSDLFAGEAGGTGTLPYTQEIPF